MALSVEIVATNRKVWSGEASMVVLRTLDGELGVLPGRSPLMGSLQEGPVLVKGEDREHRFAVHGGFVTVDHDNVIILAEDAEEASEIDVERAERAKAVAEEAEDAAAVRRAETRIRVGSHVK